MFLTDELECCYVRVRVQGDVTTEADRRIYGMHLCWHTHICFPLRERIYGFPLAQRRSDSVSPLRVENEVRTSAGSKRSANALDVLCNVIVRSSCPFK
ncbi:hypothetical protein L210DRAFT_3516645 [Boletus edulis BED1]|uniref:Uncharacterized protein n=1 Tax=Boletus edulis BED1 TaxID=1328754 RepID=A0AAD4GLV5_BOLED|nr:hypothetical protein L210DRAFT_3567450 [Boletus edulis BED1]KAF8452062.1 hypothetical protein L210DRAFT_3516645 [Boletus edulis BED1]